MSFPELPNTVNNPSTVTSTTVGVCSAEHRDAWEVADAAFALAAALLSVGITVWDNQNAHLGKKLLAFLVAVFCAVVSCSAPYLDFFCAAPAPNSAAIFRFIAYTLVKFAAPTSACHTLYTALKKLWDEVTEEMEREREG